MADPLPPQLIAQAGQIAAQRTIMPIEAAVTALTGIQKTFQEVTRRRERDQELQLKVADMRGNLRQLGLDLNETAPGRLDIVPAPLLEMTERALAAKQAAAAAGLLKAQTGLAQQEEISRLLQGAPGQGGLVPETIGPGGLTYRVPGSTTEVKGLTEDAEKAIGDIMAADEGIPALQKQYEEMQQSTDLDRLIDAKAKKIAGETALRASLSKLPKAEVERMIGLYGEHPTIGPLLKKRMMDLGRGEKTKPESAEIDAAVRSLSDRLKNIPD